ncbi:AAA family ATPase [Anaerobiospirillum thomasii]|uniref:Predicted AAA-ATPase n=1 Tax=Anaerobiospirillum thomasii TaxID=179995 RepID=A0A2X0WXL0_9GAMM|nr:AAA family ATPase [Anaerobiospirillum thomasii]SPT70261.1 Predicted AAA-ATPase [Anaerobiospirillum thomasii]
MKFQANCGVEDFKTLIETQCTYVDKTVFLKDLFWGTDYGSHRSSNTPVSVFLRPRRFGKTLTLSMIEHFCKLDYENVGNQDKARALFENLEIYKDKEFCNKHMAQYPVISISLKDVDRYDFYESLLVLGYKISKLFFNIQSNKEFEHLPIPLKKTVEFFNYISDIDIYSKKGLTDLKLNINKSLSDLSQILYLLYKRKVIVLIDEYDVPLQKAAVHGFYEEMIEVIRGIFSSVLKTNEQYLERAMLSGCMRVSKESIFTGLNNLSVFGINDERFNSFIGFTKEEARKLIRDTALETRESEIFDWYDGYNFAGAEMICPFSLLNFMDSALASSDVNNFACKNYWVNTSGNEIIDRFFTLNDAQASARLQNLIDGHEVTIKADEYVTYNEILQNSCFDDLMILMMHTGYVTAVKNEKDSFTVKIPNREVFYCFKNRVEQVFNKKNLKWVEEGLKLKEALFAGDTAKVQNIINSMLINFISVRDFGVEGNYHMFLLAVLSMFTGDFFKIDSNQESGKGYYDLSLRDRQLKTCVIIETKKLPSEAKDNEIEGMSRQALAQIENKDYATDAREDGYNIIKYGIVFFGKACYIAKG